MFSRDMTIWILAVAISVALLYNLAAAQYWQPGSTISEVVWDTARRYPLLPFMLGLCVGHLLWPQFPAGKHPGDPALNGSVRPPAAVGATGSTAKQ